MGQHADGIRSHLLDKYKIDTKAVRPRGIILVGNARHFTEQKQRDDFRLLSQGIKNIVIVTYDELVTRLQNYITVLEEFSRPVSELIAPRPMQSKNGKLGKLKSSRNSQEQ